MMIDELPTVEATKELIEQALSNGVKDKSYLTVRHGGVASYNGIAMFEHNGVNYVAVGHGPKGDACTVTRDGYISFHPNIDREWRNLWFDPQHLTPDQIERLKGVGGVYAPSFLVTVNMLEAANMRLADVHPDTWDGIGYTRNKAVIAKWC